MKPVSIRLQTLDGTWETVGADRARGVFPENVRYEHDEWGASKATFDLRRDPGVQWPDLSAFTPVEIEIGGVVVWDGRIKSAPARDDADPVIAVECEGWQFHLDDDLIDRFWVHTRLSDWRDVRSHTAANVNTATTSSSTAIGNYPAAGSVATDQGGITLSYPRGQIFPGFGRVGVFLDAGPGKTIQRVVVSYSCPADNGNFQLLLTACDVPFKPEDSYIVDGDPIGTGAITQTLSTPRRYVILALNDSGGFDQTPGQDMAVQITAIKTFASSAYESGGASTLKASTVVTDALDLGCPQLETDRTGITATTFPIDTFAPAAPASPRQLWQAVNAFHDWIAKIVRRRPVFKSRPTSPSLEAGSWPGVTFTDQSAGSGDDIFNVAYVTGKAGDGSPVAVQRISGQSGSVAMKSAQARVPNPSFDTNATGWTGTATVSRETTLAGGGSPHTAPGCGRIVRSGPNIFVGDEIKTTLTGPFLPGVAYTVSVAINNSPGLGNFVDFTHIELGTATDFARTTFDAEFDIWVVLPLNQLVWSPRVPVATAELRIRVAAINDVGSSTCNGLYVDTVQLQEATPTLASRRGFRRAKELPVSNALTDAMAERLGDTWLDAHRTTPFKGALTAIGDQAIRDPRSGAGVPFERLGLFTGELVRLSDRIDPDTGNVGRDGRLVNVRTDVTAGKAELTLDNTSRSFDALLARFAVVSGG